MQTEATTPQASPFQIRDLRDEWMVQEYMAKGFDRETAEALTVLNNRGQHAVEG